MIWFSSFSFNSIIFWQWKYTFDFRHFLSHWSYVNSQNTAISFDYSFYEIQCNSLLKGIALYIMYIQLYIIVCNTFQCLKVSMHQIYLVKRHLYKYENAPRESIIPIQNILIHVNLLNTSYFTDSYIIFILKMESVFKKWWCIVV